MKVYSVVGQWIDNSMAIPKYPKIILAQYTNFEEAIKYRDRLKRLNAGDCTVAFYIVEGGCFTAMSSIRPEDVPFVMYPSVIRK